MNDNNNNNEVGGMFSNTGDSSQVDRSTEGGVGGTFSNSNSSDSQPRAPINPNNNPAGTFDNDSNAPSAGYDNNVDNSVERDGEGKKRGLMSKVKDAFVPKPGGVGRDGDLTSNDAADFHPEREGGKHEQADRDLNRE